MKNVIVISSVETNETKMRVPGCNVRQDGTVWCDNRMPICVIGHLENADSLKVKYAAAVKGKRFDEIDPEHMARIGVIGKMRIEWEDDYEARMLPQRAAEARERHERELRQIVVHLSSRGWGDYSGVEWRGDRETPTAQIVSECQGLLKSGHDVDRPDQSDEEISALVTTAKLQSHEREDANKTLADTVVPAAAIAAYSACGGNPDNLPDDIDNPQYWLVSKYAAAIEHQGLARGASTRKLSAQLQEMAREMPQDY